MNLIDLSKILYKNSRVTVMTYFRVGDARRLLWEGRAADLQNWNRIGSWIVVEVLVDHNDMSEIADYNKGKIILVI